MPTGRRIFSHFWGPWAISLNPRVHQIKLIHYTRNNKPSPELNGNLDVQFQPKQLNPIFQVEEDKMKLCMFYLLYDDLSLNTL